MNRYRLFFYIVSISISTILNASQTEVLFQGFLEETIPSQQTITSSDTVKKTKKQFNPEKETILYQYLDEQVAIVHQNLNQSQVQQTYPTTFSIPLIPLNLLVHLMLELPNQTELHFDENGTFLYLAKP